MKSFLQRLGGLACALLLLAAPAAGQDLLLGGVGGPGATAAPAGSTLTFHAASANALVLPLTNADQTVSQATATTYTTTRTTLSATKHYVLYTTSGWVTNAAIAVADASFNNASYPGATTHALGLFGNGDILFNGTTQVTGGVNFGTSFSVLVAIDNTARKVWFYVPTFGWMGASGSNDPVTNTGGASFALMDATVYAGIGLYTTGNSATIDSNYAPVAAQVTALQGASFTPY